jgi:hypothetical protein
MLISLPDEANSDLSEVGDSGADRRSVRVGFARATVLDMGESATSSLVETILHAVDQYQSENSGDDIRYKMGQKAKNGGTIGLAALGFLNVRDHVEGREIRTVTLDPQREPLITQAFELYGTSQYSATEVLERITAAGLRTRGDKNRSPQPLSISRFYALLSDRYYLGGDSARWRGIPGSPRTAGNPRAV